MERAINAPKQKHVLNDVPKGTIDAGEERQKIIPGAAERVSLRRSPSKFSLVLYSTPHTHTLYHAAS